MTVRHDELSHQDLDRLKNEITEYYETYYAELRSRIYDHNSGLLGSVPDHLSRNRRIVIELGQDGLVVTHWLAGEDSFDFHISPKKTVQALAAEHCAGEQILDYTAESDFGVYKLTEPLKLTVGDDVVWAAEWKRMDISSRPDAWQSTDRAREEAAEDLAPYESRSGR